MSVDIALEQHAAWMARNAAEMQDLAERREARNAREAREKEQHEAYMKAQADHARWHEDQAANQVRILEVAERLLAHMESHEKEIAE